MRMNPRRFCCLPLACLFLATLGSIHPAFGQAVQAEAQVSAPIPLKVFHSGHIAVNVRVNGQGPFRLVLDTGSPVTFLSRRAAVKLGLVSAASAGQNDGIMGLSMGLGAFRKVKTFSVGGATANDFSLMILDHPVIDMISALEGPVDGIVGFSFFTRFRTTLDYAAERVHFTPVAYEPPDVVQNVMKALMNRSETKKVIASSGLWGMATAKSEDTSGALITEVYPQSAAEAGGLRAGDRITTVNGRWTESPLAFYEAAAGIKAGQTASVKVLRNGKEIELKIVPRSGV